MRRIIVLIFILIMLSGTVVHPDLVAAAPAISLTPTVGVSGTKVSVSGTSFSSYYSDQLSVFFDKTEVMTGKVASTSGVFQFVFTVPDDASPGAHTVSAREKSGTILAERQFNVPSPEIILNKWGGTVGTTIDVFCRGFYAGAEADIQYYPTSVMEIIGTKTANDIGEFSTKISITPSALGSHKIIVKNQKGDSAEAQFDVIPSIGINPSIGAVGDKINVMGLGFAANTEVGVSIYGNRVAFARVHERGSFDAIFNVPVIKAGTYAIEIEDSSRIKRWIDFTVDSRITLDKTAGEIGTKLTLKGTSFEVGGVVTVKYDAEEISRTLADTKGSFSVSFNVPVSVFGSHIITVSDGFNTRQFLFKVESEPPSAPKPIVPKAPSMVGANVGFDWESVYDPSEPVVYTLQVARDDDFFNPLLVKEDLTVSQYVLTDEEALRPSRRLTHYYWRIRAADSALNVGEWSKPVAFQVSPRNTLPGWARYVLGGCGFLLIVLLILSIRGATKVSGKQENNQQTS